MSFIFKKKQEYTNRKQFVLSDSSPFAVKEAFRNLKASLSVSLPKKDNGEGIAILLTSASPEDGKTTVAVNLALTIAESNLKVLLIDADVRKGRVARFFDVKSTPGLTDYLSGQATLKEVSHVVEGANKLTFITCGTRSPRPYELLESNAMKNLLSKLKKSYDYVIIDTPPALMISDAIALIPETDGTMVVCRHKSSFVSDIAKTLNTLNFAKANILGVVINDYKGEEKFGGYKKYSNTYGYYEATEVDLDPVSEEKTE